MKKELIHYNIDPIDELGANFNLIVGERSGGKSYQAKHKKAVNKFLFGGESYHDQYFDKGNIVKKTIEKGTRFLLLRRFKDEISTANIEQYFDDVDIEKLTNGASNCVSAYKQRIYLATYNVETGKLTRHNYIGYYRALTQEQTSAGNSLLDVTDIIFEEFMSRTMYLPNEPDKLMNLYSTVDRKRGIVRVWMLGNTITQVCPYFPDWGLDEIFRTIKQGEIKSKWISTDNYDDNGRLIEVKIAIEYCKEVGRSSYTFGKHKDMLNSGAWQSDPQPKLPKSKNDYSTEFMIGFAYKTFKFIGELLCDEKTGDLCWFIYPFKNEFNNDLLVFSDIIKPSMLWQKDIYNITLNNDRIKKLLNRTFREHNIFYASDRCGTDFKQVIDFTILK